MHVDLPLSPLPGRLRVWLFKDVENVTCVSRRERLMMQKRKGENERSDGKEAHAKPPKPSERNLLFLSGKEQQQQQRAPRIAPRSPSSHALALF